MDEALYQMFHSALAAMGGSEGSRGPRPLFETMKSLASIDGVDLTSENERALWAAVTSDNPNDSAQLELGRLLRRWDTFEHASWINATASHSGDRRSIVYEMLAIPESLIDRLGQIFPMAKPPPRSIVIAEHHTEWYTLERQGSHDFYWTSFARYLDRISDWPEVSIDSLNKATSSIVERLSDPEVPDIYPVRGLVVGYVQSGKTANFTAVTAKAADAGYRLIIILAGTLNVLRSQTQRRVDKELVGRELLEASGTNEYTEDRDWPDKFVSYDSLPSELGYFDWARLTDSQADYQSLRHGIQALEFDRRFADRRFNDPMNLHPAQARIIVIKKIPSVMKKLNADLGRIRAALEEIPTLIIDDESDQASVNTRDPKSGIEKQRTATNDEIVKLLRILPRAQYIGYTATPFANVFVDPSDAEDLFPKDFIIALPRPEGYMGVRDFFDFADDWGDLPDEELPAGYLSNERAFVRDVYGEDTDDDNLKKAILSFILSGALKLYRVANGIPVSTTHHTMLVHKSVKQADHIDDAVQVEGVYHNLNRGSESFYANLKTLWRDDFKKVSSTREPEISQPESFKELKAFVDQCINLIEAEQMPVRIVNGDKNYADQLPDFDRQSVWGILVGGTKLSRGYTVEGLSVSYYRRRIKQADTLMQVGRWFGFRRGYRDLVRLFVGREEPDGRNGTFDLYLAFKSICKDEEAFRAQLDRYSKKEGQDRILPKQVPPLVPSHLLRPTSKNKMFNARILFENLGGQRSEKGSTPENVSGKRANAKALKELLGDAKSFGRLDLSYLLADKNTVSENPTVIWQSTKEALIAFMDAYRWQDDERYFQREIEFLQGTDDKDPEIDRVLILAPQRKRAQRKCTWECAGEKLSVWSRRRISGRRFGAISGSVDREIGDYYANVPCKVIEVSPEMEQLRAPRTAVLLVYPILPTNDPLLEKDDVDDSEISIGVGIRFPTNSIPAESVFGTFDPTKEENIVVATG